MPVPGSIKPKHKAIAEYHEALHAYSDRASRRSGGNRRENVTDWALKQFRAHYKDKKICKWDIFYYVYGLLHHAGYRGKFADNLKRELPRMPLAPGLRRVQQRRPGAGPAPSRLRKAGALAAGLARNPRRAANYRVEKDETEKDKTP